MELRRQQGLELSTPKARALLELFWACAGEFGSRRVLKEVARAGRTTLEARQVVIELSVGRAIRVSDPDGHGAPRAVTWEGSDEVLSEPVYLDGEVIGHLRVADKEHKSGFTPEDRAIAELLAALAGAAIRRDRLLEEQQRREHSLARLHEITGLLLGGRDPAGVLRLVARGARDLAKADLALVLLLTPDASRRLIVRATEPEGADTPLGSELRSDDPIVRQVLETGKPAVFDHANSSQHAHQEAFASSIGPTLVVPLILRSKPSGALIVARFPGSTGFNESDVSVIDAFAAQASVALDDDRARREQERLAVIHDEERIARDLHDKVIQQLFATGISLQSAVRRIDDADVAARVLRAVDVLDRTVKDIRSTIFALHEPGEDQSLEAAIVRLASDYGWSCGFRTHVEVRSTSASAVTQPITGQVVATVQEALSNVARHAKASEVEVDVMVGYSELFLRVLDDGIGFEPGRVGSGLRNLDKRVRDLGGTMSMKRRPEGGSVLEWRVPLRNVGTEAS